MKDLKPEVSPAAKPINPAELRKILRDRVDIFGKEDQQVKCMPLHVCAVLHHSVSATLLLEAFLGFCQLDHLSLGPCFRGFLEGLYYLYESFQQAVVPYHHVLRRWHRPGEKGDFD